VNVKRLATLFLLLPLACDKPTGPLPREPITVFATMYPLAEIAREIGGEDVRTDWLIELGKPIDGFILTRRERDRMASTDYTLCDSYNRTETWAAIDLAQRKNTGRVMTCDSLPASGEPHYPGKGLIYLDPTAVKQLTPVLRDAFARIWPEHAEAMRRRAEAFSAQLDALIAKYPPGSFGGGKVMALSPLFNPLLARFGIDYVVEERDAYRLSDADLAAIKYAASRAGCGALLLPYDLPPGTVARIEDGTGLNSFPMDACGYSGFKQHDTYLGLLQADLEQLRAATSGPSPRGEVR